MGAVTNSGTVDPGAAAGGGLLALAGAYTQTPTGSLNLKIGGPTPGTGFATLEVSNTAILDGALNLTLENGYVPPTNSTFTFLKCANRSGTFTRFNYPSNQFLMNLVYTPTNVAVQVVKAPSPKTFMLSLSFGGATPGGATTLGFYGIPGSEYAVQYAPSILGPWLNFATNFAAPDGSLSVVDTNPVTVNRFYRVKGL